MTGALRRTAGMVLLLAAMAVPLGGAATVVVTSAASTINGDTSSPEALIANPGPDGICFLEAILAVNHAAGPNTIQFSTSLAGRTIHPEYGMSLDRDGISIIGFNGPSGRPDITFDASALTGPLFAVLASDFTLMRVRVVNLHDTFGVWLNAGEGGAYPTPREARNITIDGNDFSNEGLLSSSIPITLGTAYTSSGATLRNVVIKGNTFSHYRIGERDGGDGIHIHLGGEGSVIQDLLIEGNVFNDVAVPVELVPDYGTNARIVRTRIVGNTILSSGGAINLNMISNGTLTGSSIEDTLIAQNEFQHTPLSVMIISGLNNATGNAILNTRIAGNRFTDNPEGNGFGVIRLFGGINGASGNRIDGVRIEGNVFQRSYGPAIAVQGGLSGSNGNSVRNVEIVNNLITRNTNNGGISIIAGIDRSDQNHLENVTLANNTIANNAGNALSVSADEGGTGNVLSNVNIVNTLFWNNGNDVVGLTAEQVFSSILLTPGLAGTNGNLASDPRFVDASHDDFHLSSNSPAIHRGSAAGAPSDDLECRPRLAPPDIGAYESGGPSGCRSLSEAYRLTVERVGPGSGTVLSSGMGIDCGTACTAEARAGFLIAVPSAGSLFTGWSGCDSAAARTCSVNALLAPRTVTATFSLPRHRAVRSP
jgi:hypothetical protein